MHLSDFSRRAFYVGEALLLAGTAAAVVLLASAQEWQPLGLVTLLLLLALGGQWLSVDIRGGQLSASMVAIVIAMGLLGPGPAAACGVAAIMLKALVRRLALIDWMTNLCVLATIPFAGAMLVRLAKEEIPTLSHEGLTPNITFGLVLFGAVLVAIALTFCVFALSVSIADRRPLRHEMRELLPLLPGELATGALATMLAVAYKGIGLSVLVAAIVILVIFQRLTVALLRSEDRAEQLFARSRQLVGLQLGVLRTLVRALGMRDETTARHAAAVARYAKSLAAQIGAGSDEQDMIHTAGLLHDIGKFTWPDRILHAEVIAQEDMTTVQSHPQEGSILVGTLDGYGEVADAILYHHERIDGRGYPAGLIGNEIPLGSRILAICSNYDTMTAVGGYRPTMTPEEAITELRSSARNGQLDPDLVEAFIAVLEREGLTFGREADFETELDFERRVRQLAEPHAAGHER